MKHQWFNQGYQYQAGATLIELVLTIVILSIAMVAVVSVYSNAISRSADPLIHARSIELAQAYLDEILTKKYDENTPAGGFPVAGSSGGPSLSSLGADSELDRTQYDDVDDFDGQTYSVPQFITGNNFSQYVNYQISIAVAYAGTEVGANHNQHVKRIDVTISNPLGNTMVFSAYKGNY